VVIPRYENNIKYIKNELEELETETYIKLKKVLSNKIKIEIEEARQFEERQSKNKQNMEGG